jgi:hypothetical protein
MRFLVSSLTKPDRGCLEFVRLLAFFYYQGEFTGRLSKTY